jgi:HEAT repeat protein
MRSTIVLPICLLLTFAAGTALAAGGAPKKSARLGAGLSLEEVAVMLGSPSDDEVRMALESAPSLRNRQATPLIIERVRSGLKPALLLAAVDALGALGDPRAAELLAQLTRHRRPQVRVRAVLALAALKTEATEPALVRALSDPAEEVRDAAADGLALAGAKHALAPLFQAFDRGVGRAGPAIGELAEPSVLPRITSYFGRVSFVGLEPMLDALFLRRNLSEETKLGLVQSIAKQGDAGARGYLEGLGEKLPADAPAGLRRSITETVARMPR